LQAAVVVGLVSQDVTAEIEHRDIEQPLLDQVEQVDDPTVFVDNGRVLSAWYPHVDTIWRYVDLAVLFRVVHDAETSTASRNRMAPVAVDSAPCA
jgi:hypothetical protein